MHARCQRNMPWRESVEDACGAQALRAACDRFLVADPAPLWQRPLVALSGLFLKSPVQVRRDVWRPDPILAREHPRAPCRAAPRER